MGIPTVLDRVIQQAIAQVLTPLFDPHFSTHSCGFRVVMLDPLDQELEKRGLRFARYADDFLILGWDQPYLSRGAGAGSVDSTTGPVVLLETVETAGHPTASSALPGHPPG